MKKNGFTLAEVLITLAIIGVVATMTLPALITNTGEQQAKTGLKKAINTLTEAGQMNNAVDNFAYDNVLSHDEEIDDDSVDTQTLYAILAKRLNVDFTLGNGAARDGHETQLDDMNTVLYLRDGSAIFFNKGTKGSDSGELQDDNLPEGYDVVYDTNGVKGPNILSNCLGTVAGASDVDNDGADCNDKAKRVIKDQFVIRLRGSIAQPSGAASNWAFNN